MNYYKRRNIKIDWKEIDYWMNLVLELEVKYGNQYC